VFLFGADLNFDTCFVSSFPRLTFLGISHESWQDAFRAVDGESLQEAL
jgi:hypothetical protein